MKVLHDMLLPPLRGRRDTVLGEDPLDGVASEFMSEVLECAFRRRVYPHVGFSRATRTMSSRMSFAVGGRPGLRFLLPSYLAAMRWRYQSRSGSGCGNGRNLGQRLAAQSLGLDREPAPVVVRETETLAPKPGSEHTVLLLLVVDHILLLAVDPAS